MRRALAIPMLAFAAACSFEPVRPPAVPGAAQYTAGASVEKTASADVPGGAAQQFIAGKDIPAQWWTLFRSPTLDRLVRDALDNSPSLARAAAKLRQAQENYAARSGATELPKVDASLSATRVDANLDSSAPAAITGPLPLDLFLASVKVSYTFDFFGATRHELDALRSETDFQRYELEAARLALAANVVTAAIRAASAREQIARMEEVTSLRAKQVAIAERMESLGGMATAEVAAQRQELADVRALLPEARRNLEQLRHRLAIYTGRAPGAPGLPEVRFSELTLPTELPLSLPSELARQRPDIRAADALLQQAGSRVGVATANFYPQITLSASVGALSASGSGGFSPDGGFYLLGLSLVQPLFRGNELQARRRGAVAAYEQAAAAYQEAVLQGFQNVADTLRALESDAEKLKERAAAAGQARSAHDIASRRFAAGGVSQFALLDAERKLRSAEIEQIRATADRYADSAALLQSLGGGWWREE